MKYTITDINQQVNAVAIRIDFTDEEVEKYKLRPAELKEDEPIFDTQAINVDLSEYEQQPVVQAVYDEKGKPVNGEDGQQLQVQVGTKQVKRDRAAAVKAAVEQRMKEYQAELDARQVPDDLNELVGKTLKA
jgi:hypothetical protein